MKRTIGHISFILALLTLMSVLPFSSITVLAAEHAKSEDNGTYILYEENFDGVSSRFDLDGGNNISGPAAGWIYGRKSLGSEAYIENGRLYFSGHNYDVIYRDGGETWGNYTLEADFCYTEGNVGWGGMLYNVQSATKFQKGNVSVGGTYALNGYDGKWTNDISGVNVNLPAMKEDVPRIGDPFRMRITVHNRTSTLYYAPLNSDGKVKSEFKKLVTIDNIPGDAQTGSIGFMTSANKQAKFWVDNIKCYSDSSVSYYDDFDSYGDLTLSPSTVNTASGLNYVKNSTSACVGRAEIKNGELYLSGGTSKLDAILFGMGKKWTNYVFEADFKYVDEVEGSNNNGWAGLMFRSTDTSNFYKAIISPTGSVKMNCKLGGSWYMDSDARRNANYGKPIAIGEALRYRFIANEKSFSLYVAPYVNGELSEWVHLITIKDETLITDSHMLGTVGLMVGGANAELMKNVCIDNVSVSRIENSDRYLTDNTSIADIYEPKSGVVNPPVVVQMVNNALPSVTGERAAVTLLELDSNMNVLKADKSILTSAASYIDTYRKVLIPAFIIDSEAEADALAALIKEKALIDCYVVADSENASLVRRVRMANTTTKLITGALVFDDLNTLSARQSARALVADNMSYVAISRTALSEEAAHYFNLRQIAAWGLADVASDVYKAISNGWHGIVSDDISTVYDVYESIEEVTVSGKPIIIAHRGNNEKSSVSYPENTLIGFRSAKTTYGADAVELDFGLTKDGYAILMHDNTVDRTTNGTGSFSQLSLEEIKALTVDYVKGKETTVPTLEEAILLAKELDIVLYCHTKSNTDANIGAFSYLVEKHEAWDYVVLFAADRTVYNSNNTRRVSSQAYGFSGKKSVTDGIVFTAGDASILSNYNTTYLEGVEKLKNHLNPYNYQALFYPYNNQGWMWNKETFYYSLSARGFVNSHSITVGQDEMDSTALYESGVVGYLTDTLHLCDDYHYDVDLSSEKLTLNVGETLDLQRKLKLIKGSVRASCKFVQLSGPSLVLTEDGYTLNEVGSVTLVYYADRTASGGSRYRVYSEPITITFGNDVQDNTEIQAALEEAIKALEDKIASQDHSDSLKAAIDDLTRYLADAKAALESSDAETKAELERSIARGTEILDEATKLLQNPDSGSDTVTDDEQNKPSDEENKPSDEQNKTDDKQNKTNRVTVIVPCTISFVCAVLVILLVAARKKKR